MNFAPLPKLSIPAPLIGAEKGSFTEFTVTQRMPDIARRIVKENNFPSDINDKLENLANELVSGDVQPLQPDTGADFSTWQKYLEPYQGQRWIDIPWFFAETYFYRLILNITNYFNPGQWEGVDPFALQKERGLESSLDAIATLSSQVEKWLNSSIETEMSPELSNHKALIALLYFDLWGNRVDLSLWSALGDENRAEFDIDTQQGHILVDDSEQVANLLTKLQSGRVDFIVDNAGFELICDLCLVDFILSSGLVSQAKLHLKPHPTFVSDATIKDVLHTIDLLANSNKGEIASSGQRLQRHLGSEKLILTDNYFWTSPLAAWEISDPLKNELGEAELIIVKGDANYRRLLGDRHWNYSTDIADIVCYLPSPMIALRTLKSEVAAGIPTDVIAKLNQTDPNWLTNGQWGVVQLVMGNG
ncbi:damage-control phosphatase ARMT1 family protein [Mastigocoleus testarum]|uniref:Damage-control phosphatase ARMT1-like metal-binding domain-containing protein n=1 Tax=Mastigocoleus testarum BC008 TaxID=371196 RepID=A0A0V7ZJC9_9CYAN|nr:damage-control phosphatase ARMT1 family protein [Mastigocoleus testarum]KST64545.1 hypothetical protein BC008_18125 [Mastigocoleus testarum BC008]